MRLVRTASAIVLLSFHATGTVMNASTPAEADVEHGRKVFEACAACHATDQPARTGPELRGVFGRRAGTVPGFRYSRVLKNAKIVWNAATLESFLADPQAAFPGNIMPYPGLPDATQRRALIAYLRTLK
jgi:cytochrome c